MRHKEHTPSTNPAKNKKAKHKMKLKKQKALIREFATLMTDHWVGIRVEQLLK